MKIKVNFTKIKELLAQVERGDHLLKAMKDDAEYETLGTAGRLLVDIVKGYNAEHADGGSSFRLAVVFCSCFDGSVNAEWWEVHLMDGDVTIVRLSADSLS